MNNLVKLHKQSLLGLFFVAIMTLIACKPEETPAPSVPTAPELITPADGAENMPVKPMLTWEASSAENGIKEYALYLDTNSDPTTLISTGTTTSLAITTSLDYGTTYYWKVQVKDNKDLIATSEIFSFSTISDALYELSDDVFGGILEGLGHASVINDSYYLDTESVTDIIEFDLGGTSGTPVNVTNIDGIQFFTSLRELIIDYSSISQLDLSNNANLDTLQYTNAATNTANFLTTLSLPTGMRRIRIFRHNLSDFIASSFSDLEYLRLDGDNIPNAAVGGVTNVLSTLTLDADVNTNLIHLDMGGNLDGAASPITYEVSQVIYDRLTSSSGGNKDGVVVPATFEISSVGPEDDATDVATNTAITVTFSSDINASSLAYTLKAGSTDVPHAANVDGAVLTLTPSSNLSVATEYTLEITAAQGLNGASIASTSTYTFTTIAPGVVTITNLLASSKTLSTSATIGQVNRKGTLVITFSTSVQNTFSSGSYTLKSGGNAVASGFNANGATVTITPSAALGQRASYELTILSANPIADNSGSLSSDAVYNFSTAFFGGGDGTANYPFEVDEAVELDTVRRHLDSYFQLTSNVDLNSYLTGSGWDPIDLFTGSFDGNSFVIQNIWITSGTSFTGLFGQTTGGSIFDLGLTVHSTGILGADRTGALIGELDGGTVSRCYVTGGNVATNIAGTASRTGGFVGYITAGSISESFSTVDVGGTSVSGSSIADRIGGFVGGVGSGLGSISNCYATGNVSGDADTGGFIGWLNSAFTGANTPIQSSYSSGDVTTTDATTSGIFSGNDLQGSTITTSYYNTDAILTGGNSGITINGLTGVSFNSNGSNSGSFPGLSGSTWTFGQSGISGSNGPVLSWEIQ